MSCSIFRSTYIVRLWVLPKMTTYRELKLPAHAVTKSWKKNATTLRNNIIDIHKDSTTNTTELKMRKSLNSSDGNTAFFKKEFKEAEVARSVDDGSIKISAAYQLQRYCWCHGHQKRICLVLSKCGKDGCTATVAKKDQFYKQFYLSHRQLNVQETIDRGEYLFHTFVCIVFVQFS